MNRVCILLILIFLCGCTSCNKEPFKEDYINISNYDIPIINATEIDHKIPDEERFGFFDIRIANDIVIVSKEYNDYLIHFINTESFNTIAKIPAKKQLVKQKLTHFYNIFAIICIFELVNS